MPTYEYTGEQEFHLRAGEVVITQGDEIELDELPANFEERFREVPDASDSDVSGGESGSEEPEGESISEEAEPESGGDEGDLPEPPLNLTELTVDALKSELESQEFSDEELRALIQAEEGGASRSSAVEAIEAEL